MSKPNASSSLLTLAAALVAVLCLPACQEGETQQQDGAESRSRCAADNWVRAGEGPLQIRQIDGAQLYIPRDLFSEQIVDGALISICTGTSSTGQYETTPLGPAFDFRCEDGVEGGHVLTFDAVITLPFDANAFEEAGGDQGQIAIMHKNGANPWSHLTYRNEDLNVQIATDGASVSFRKSAPTISEAGVIFQVVYQR